MMSPSLPRFVYGYDETDAPRVIALEDGLILRLCSNDDPDHGRAALEPLTISCGELGILHDVRRLSDGEPVTVIRMETAQALIAFVQDILTGLDEEDDA